MSNAKTLETLMTLGMIANNVVEMEPCDAPPVDGEWSTAMQDAFAKAQVAAEKKKSDQPAQNRQ